MQLTILGFIIRRFRRESKGAIAVEFAIICIPLLMLLLFTMELGRIFYLYSAIDLSLAEASATAARSNNNGTNEKVDYAVIFDETFKKNIKNMPLINKDNPVTLSVKYCNNIDDIINKKCSKNNSTAPLAVYNVRYPYKALIYLFPEKLITDTLDRNIVIVQEFNRGKV